MNFSQGLAGAVLAGAFVCSAARAETIYAVNGAGQLLKFDAASPGTIASTNFIGGLPPGESLVGIDFRPATGGFYGVGSAGHIFRIDLETGDASQVATMSVLPNVTAGVGVDFDPTSDLLRVVTADTNQNLLVNVQTGATSVATPLAYAAGDENVGAEPAIVGLALDRSDIGASETTAFALDSALNRFVRIGDVDGAPNPANGGQLTTLDFDVLAETISQGGFDFSSESNVIYFTGPAAGTVPLHFFDPEAGAFFLIGQIPSATGIRGLAVAPPVFKMVGLTTTNSLVFFDSDDPGDIDNEIVLTGTIAGETIRTIDFRPSDCALIGAATHVYSINIQTGVCTSLGDSPTLNPENVDFDPVTDDLRLFSVGNQNFTVGFAPFSSDTHTGLTYAAGDTYEAFTPSVVGLAYDRSFPGVAISAAYAIDDDRDALVTLRAPDTGQLRRRGELGRDITSGGGFDIAAPRRALLAYVGPGASFSSFGSVNLTTGLLSVIGALPAATVLRDVAVRPKGALTFSAASYNVAESGGTLDLVVTRTPNSEGVLGIRATAVSQSADPSDIPSINYLAFFGGTDSQTFPITIIPDLEIEDVELAAMQLYDVTGGGVIGPLGRVPIVITDDEVAPRTVYALAQGNRLVTFRVDQPGAILNDQLITNLFPADLLLGIDLRSHDGQLVAYSTSGRIYSIDRSTAVATLISANPIAPPLGTTATALDVNPQNDVLRIFGGNQTLIADFATGATFQNGTVVYQAGDPHFGDTPLIAGAAHTNSFFGATSTDLFAIDPDADALVQVNQITGRLETRAPILQNVSDDPIGYDISSFGSNYVSCTLAGESGPRFYRLFRTSSTADLQEIGPIGGTSVVIDIAVERSVADHLVQFLLGTDTNGAGLDINGDTAINSADLVRRITLGPI